MSITDKPLYRSFLQKRTGENAPECKRACRFARQALDWRVSARFRACCPEPSGISSAVVGALAVRHGVQALALLLFVHPEADGDLYQQEADHRDHARPDDGGGDRDG